MQQKYELIKEMGTDSLVQYWK